jgi:hypothetical protein
MLTEEEWQRIQEYYLTNAPDTIETRQPTPTEPLIQFNTREIALKLRGDPLVTLVKYDSANRKLFIGNRYSKLYRLTGQFVIEDSLQLNSAPSSMIFSEDRSPIITVMGIMDPNDQEKGEVIQVNENNTIGVLTDSLKRPVDLKYHDLNRDGKNEMIVSEFGNYTGALTIFEKRNNEYKPNTIYHAAGVRKVEITDFNADGLPDILALITQGDEQLILFLNLGDLNFKAKTILRFPPVYGSIYFELIDMDNDGDKDIIYTNGDNADYSAILKPYHGVRIFLNDGEGNYEESWFYPMHGAFQTVVKDFDQDGDKDIAAISFFPEYKESRAVENFLYFENVEMKFRSYSTPLSSSARWITMEVADFDHDNDDDIILGALNFNRQIPHGVYRYVKEKNVSLLVLENIKFNAR